MPTNVPTQAEFDALSARVTKLEQGTTPLPPISASPEGTKVTDTMGVLIADDGSHWKLVGPSSNYQIQWQPAGASAFVAAGVSAQVSAILKQSGIHQTSPNSSGISQPGWWKAAWSGAIFQSWTAEPKPAAA